MILLALIPFLATFPAMKWVRANVYQPKTQMEELVLSFCISYAISAGFRRLVLRGVRL